MASRIVLIVLDEMKRPYAGTFDSAQPLHPKIHPNGALWKAEHAFLVELARRRRKKWIPADPRDPANCVPCWIVEAFWGQLGKEDHYKFIFNPPLEVKHEAWVSGV